MEFGIHYVPYGEVIAYMLAWRRLVRRWQGAHANPWAPELWHGVQRTYENELSRVFSPTPPAYLKEHRVLREVVEALESVPGAADWERDMQCLLLQDESQRPGLAFDALKIFAATLPNFAARADLGSSARDLLEFADALLLRPEFGGLMIATASRGELLAAFRRLHEHSRFPILPYYYWTAISRRPRTHAVLPIWTSISSPLLTPVFTPVVGMAVADLIPLAGLDGTWRPSADSVLVKRERQRLRNLTSAIRVISQPQVDSVYYREIQMRKAEARASAQTIDYLSHDTKRPVEDIRRCLNAAEGGMSLTERAELAKELAADLIERIGSNVNVAAPLGEAAFAQEVRLEAANASEWISICDLADRIWARSILRYTFANASAARDWLRYWDDLGPLEYQRRWLRKEQPRFVVCRCSKCPSIPSKVVRKRGEAGSESGRIYSALCFIFSEIFENFLKHDATSYPADAGRLTCDIHVELMEGGSYSASAGLYRIIIRLSPTYFRFPAEGGMKIQRSTGLNSLAKAVEGIYASMPKVRFNESSTPWDLPFFELKEGACEWRVEGLLIEDRCA